MPGILYPTRCILCRKLLMPKETDLCHDCRASNPECTNTKRAIPFVAKWTALWYYKDNVGKSIRRFKFSNARSYANAYARMLARKLLEEDFLLPDTVITWVPVSFFRKFTRGYDQSELLAKALARELNCPAVRLLRKFRHTQKQSGLRDVSARKANVLGVYRILDRTAVAGKFILLVDDVVTTGATASECAKMLMTASAEEVRLAAVASALRDNTKKYR